MLDGNLNPKPATDVVVILRPIPVRPIRVNKLLPSLKVTVKLRASESVNALGWLAPSANRLSDGAQVILRQSELKLERRDFHACVNGLTGKYGTEVLYMTVH
jgi:hypothetical protein